MISNSVVKITDITTTTFVFPSNYVTVNTAKCVLCYVYHLYIHIAVAVYKYNKEMIS